MSRIHVADRDYIDAGQPILPTKDLDWSSNDLCVRFVNTAEPRTEPSEANRRHHLGLVTEPLVGYDAIVRWMEEMGGLTGAEARSLLKVSDEFPPDAIEAASRLCDLRVFLGRMVNSLADRKAPTRDDRLRLRDMVNELWQPLTWELDGVGGFWTQEVPELTLDRPFRQLVFSMARVLSTKARNRVYRCKNKDCGLLLFHGTRGRAPNWCHKSVCGEKVRKRPSRAYLRHL